ncbi:Ras- protein Rab-18 [Tritrichomonas musculus]|uniref:Ras- protein Rab-18 n=1 Tax=Tritrichomonas musculus TaxID=1915356 RepID=A0ABR2JK46_9EUKA
MERKINVLLIGEAGVGKTKFACSIHHKDYETYTPTLGVDFIHSSQECNGIKFELQTWEVSTNKMSLLCTIKQKFDCVLLCTSCEIKKSIEGMLKIQDILSETMCKNTIFILMCCKLDILANYAPIEFHYFLKELQNKTSNLTIPVLISSAETGFYVHEDFQMMIELITKRNPIQISVSQVIEEFQQREGILNF